VDALLQIWDVSAHRNRQYLQDGHDVK